MLHPNRWIPTSPPPPQMALEGGRNLCSFVSAAASNVLHTLQKPCRSRPSKRKVNLQRFLQNQICRSFSDIKDTTHQLASSIFSQEAQEMPKGSQQTSSLKSPPSMPIQTSPAFFSGIAEAFSAPDPNPSWALSLDSLMSEPDECFEPIAKENFLGLDPFEPNWPGWDAYSDSQSCVVSAACGTFMDPTVFSASASKSMGASAHDIYTSF